MSEISRGQVAQMFVSVSGPCSVHSGGSGTSEEQVRAGAAFLPGCLLLGILPNALGVRCNFSIIKTQITQII